MLIAVLVGVILAIAIDLVIDGSQPLTPGHLIVFAFILVLVLPLAVGLKAVRRDRRR